MNRITRMLLMANHAAGYDRADYDNARPEPDARFRDRQGRERNDNGRFAPMNSGGMWADGRYWDDRELYQRPESAFPASTPYVPPVYEYRDQGQAPRRPMNKIGFSVDGEMERTPPEFGREYRTDAGHRQMDETAYRQSGERMSGYGAGTELPPMTRETAQEWLSNMQNADGTKGPHWTMEKTEEARSQRGIQCDPLEFYVAMNMMYSDYVKAAEKANCSSMDFYAYMAKAFLDDKDAQPEKLTRYYRYIVER